MLDNTHDAARRSWVSSANAHDDFPIQNLPLGIFSRADGARRAGVAIGDFILDLTRLAEAGLIDAEAADAVVATGDGTLNGLFALGNAPRRSLRQQLFALLEESSRDRARVEPLLHAAKDCKLHMPAVIGDYTDFYAGIHHALNVGRLFRPENPLLPNYKYVPIGYHGRTSSIDISGKGIVRPNGQRKRPDEIDPTFGPCRNLDYELELGFWIGTGNDLGKPINIAQAADHIAGISLLNDWSARDVQAWEYQPLGPFLAKNFATTISPWVVTAEALAPFRAAQLARPDGDPAPLPYLYDSKDQAAGAFDILMEAFLVPSGAEQGDAHRLSCGSSISMYWTPGQLVAHHTSGGCNLQPGDLLGSGTLSGETPDSRGSLLEITNGGRVPFQLASGQSRVFLEDGDTVIYRGHCRRDGFASIGFGECRGTVLPAP
ncbi:MAG: fahA [Xanthobacteraceae bacterium]|nr:fahA [Xanthobacteraceae bacterium]